MLRDGGEIPHCFNKEFLVWYLACRKAGKTNEQCGLLFSKHLSCSNDYTIPNSHLKFIKYMCKSYHLCSTSDSHCRCYLLRKAIDTIVIWQGRLYVTKYYCQLARKAVDMLLTLLLKSPYEYLRLKAHRQCRTNVWISLPFFHMWDRAILEHVSYFRILASGKGVP